MLDKQTARGGRRLAWSSGHLRTRLSGEGCNFLAVPTAHPARVQSKAHPVPAAEASPGCSVTGVEKRLSSTGSQKLKAFHPVFPSTSASCFNQFSRDYFLKNQENSNATLKALGPTREKSDYLVDKSWND